MRLTTTLGAALLTVLVFTLPARGGGGPECWRRGGPPALAALMNQHADAIRQHREGLAVENWDKIAADIDAVAAQRDAWASGLYWYTDLEQAKAAARRENKPIVSLRLLGRLDAELSCANSRFFRTTLYPAAEVSRRMRENVVLHWSSERPVPTVTVDFGDGRKLERTVTGNSAHYMMTSDGAVVDVLPGLYGAKPFAAWLDEAGQLARQVAAAPEADRDRVLRAHHARKRDEIAARWAADLRRAGVTLTGGAASTSLHERRMAQPANAAPSAVRAAARAEGKLRVERPLVKLLSVEPTDVTPASSADEATWAKVAALHEADAVLDPAAVAVIRSKSLSAGPSAGVAGARSATKRQQEDPLLRVVASLQRSIAQDTVRNEYTLHAKVHEWFVAGNASTQFEPLNERVYAELFLTPRSDPWLGLAPQGAWSALEDDGLASR